MGLIKNTYSYSFAYNIKASAPIDSRMRVEYISDLTTVWSDEEAPAYAGMVVSVLEDNGLYVLKAKEGEITKPADYTDINNWIKIGTGNNEELENRVTVLESKEYKDSLYTEFDSKFKENYATLDDLDAVATATSESLTELEKRVGDIENNDGELTEILEAVNANQAALQEVGEQVEKNTSDIAEIRTAVNTDFPVKGVEVNEINVVDEETKIAKITINTETPATSKEITINGGPLASYFLGLPQFSGGTLPTGITVQEFFELLLCNEVYYKANYTSASLSYKIGSPSISRTPSSSLVEVGTDITINAVNSPSITITPTKPSVWGLTSGYSATLDGEIVKSNTITTNVSYNQVAGEVYSMTATSSGFIGTLPNDVSGANGCTLASCTLTADFGTNTYKVSVTGPKYTWGHAKIPSYYIVSSLGNRAEEVEGQTTKTNVVASRTETTSNPTNNNSFSVTGVYPIYTNMSGGTLVDDTVTRESLVSGKSITVDYIPSEYTSGKPFKLDFPKTKTVSRVDIWDPDKGVSGDWADDPMNSDTYTISGEYTKTINGVDYIYTRFQTNGKQGANAKYKLTFTTNLSQE